MFPEAGRGEDGVCLLDRVSGWGDEDPRGVVGVVAQQRECVSCTYISLFWFQVREIDGVFQLTSDLKMLSMSSLGTAVSKNDDLKKKKKDSFRIGVLPASYPGIPKPCRANAEINHHFQDLCLPPSLPSFLFFLFLGPHPLPSLQPTPRFTATPDP